MRKKPRLPGPEPQIGPTQPSVRGRLETVTYRGQERTINALALSVGVKPAGLIKLIREKEMTPEAAVELMLSRLQGSRKTITYQNREMAIMTLAREVDVDPPACTGSSENEA